MLPDAPVDHRCSALAEQSRASRTFHDVHASVICPGPTQSTRPRCAHLANHEFITCSRARALPPCVAGPAGMRRRRRRSAFCPEKMGEGAERDAVRDHIGGGGWESVCDGACMARGRGACVGVSRGAGAHTCGISASRSE